MAHPADDPMNVLRRELERRVAKLKGLCFGFTMIEAANIEGRIGAYEAVLDLLPPEPNEGE